MPIHDLGYRSWPGKYSSDLKRFWTIAFTGIKIVGRNKWVRRMLFVAWLPTLYWAGAFFGYEQIIENTSMTGDEGRARNTFIVGAASSLEGILGTEETEIAIKAMTATDPNEGRHLAWVWLLSGFLRVPQAVAVMLIIGMIAPPLIARDVRSKAFLLYFSKPINRYEYVLGKLVVIGMYVFFITCIPALGCYLLGLGLASDMWVIFHTWDIPIRIVLASLAFVIPAASVALMFSSLTNESRFAAFAWFATWLLGFVAWKVIYANVPISVAIVESQRERARLEQLYSVDETTEVSPLVNPEQAPADDPSQNPNQPEGGASDPPQRRTPDPNVETRSPESSAAETSAGGSSNQLRAPPQIINEGDGNLTIRSGDRQIRIVNGQRVYIGSNSQRDQEIGQRVGQKFQDVYQEQQKKLRRSGLSLISMYDTLVRVQRWIFGLETNFWEVFPSICMTIAVTVFSWIVLLRRVSAPIRI